MRESDVLIYNVTTDLDWSRQLKQIRKMVSDVKGNFLFDPDSFKGSNYNFSVEEHRMNNDQLLTFGEIASALRESFTRKADSIDQDPAAVAVKEFEDTIECKNLLRRSYFSSMIHKRIPNN